MMKTIYRLVVFTTLLFICHIANGQTFTYTDSSKVFIIGKQVQVLEDPAGAMTFEQVRNTAAFKPSDKDVPNFGISKSVYWLKMSVANQATDLRILLTLSYPQLDQVSFYYSDNNGNYQEELSGEQVAIPNRKYSNQNFIFDLKLPRNATKTYYVRIKSTEQMLIPLSVGSSNATFETINKQDNLTSVYFGIILVMILYNIFVYLSVKDKSYLYYVYYILFVGLTQIGFQGYSYKYMWPGLPALANQSVIFFPALTGIAAIEFFKQFLYGSNTPKKVNIILNLLNAFYALNCLLSIAGMHQLSQQLLQPNAMIASFIILGLSVNAIRKGSRPAVFFLVAWVTFLAGIVIFIMKDVGVLPYNNFTNYILQVGSAIEVVVLSFALADKINIYRAQTLKALQENEKIITEQNVVLESRVKERTHELNISNLELNKAMTELKDAETQLVESEKMASLGQLTAGIAHEINNPINFVTSNVKPLNRDVRMLLETVDMMEQVALKDTSISEKQKEIAEYKEDIDYEYLKEEIDQLLNGIGEGASRTAEIVKGLRIFSRLDEDDIKKADINEGLESTLIIANNLLNNIIKVDKHYSNIPLIECYPGKLNQVFLNMISNAVYAIKKKYGDKDGGVLGIKTSIETDYLAISISDNGTGMDETTKKKLFEPFFTTKDVGEGTGLGLSIAYNTIIKHNGTIQINSELGYGTEFIIKLPLIQK